MRVILRVDASLAIGTGHLRRCLSLADALDRRGARVSLVHRDLGLDLLPLIADAPLDQVTTLPPPAGAEPHRDIVHAHWAGVPQDRDRLETVTALDGRSPDWLVVDHYAFDRRWHDGARAALGCRIVAIDDLGDRPLSAEIVVDHNLAPDHAAKHAVSRGLYKRLLGGPDYALLAGAYRDSPRYEFNAEVRSIGIFMGGVDVPGASARALEACRAAGFAGAIEIATTSANPHLDSLLDRARADRGVEVILDRPDLAGFFARHDLQIGAGGGATWERFCMGAPTIAAAFAENQLPVLQPLEQMNVLKVVRLEGDVDQLTGAIQTMIDEPDIRRAYADRSRALVDGRGCDRVVEAMHAP